jgi:pimeloyl-ACP methyl ester carboxylesterase
MISFDLDICGIFLPLKARTLKFSVTPMKRLSKIFGALWYPQSAWGRVLQRYLPIVFLLIIFLLTLTGILVYQVVVPRRLGERVDPSNYLMLGYKEIAFHSLGKNFSGWFIPGVHSAPTLVLCHGYKSNRSELLTLAATLQENGYNLFLYDMRGHGGNPVAMTTLGFKESDDLVAAIQALSSQPGVDSKRIGLYGAGLGGYVALAAATRSNQVQALVIDSTFDSPFHYVGLQTQVVSGVDSRILRKLTSIGFWLINLPQSWPPKKSFEDSLETLGGRAKLFINNEQDRELNVETREVFEHSPFPKELKTLKASGTAPLYGMVERKNYELLVLDFFQKNLPVRLSRNPSAPQP